MTQGIRWLSGSDCWGWMANPARQPRWTRSSGRTGKSVSTISLKPDADVPGIYRGQIAGLEDGEYEVSIQASGYSESVLKARSQFVVLPAETGELDETAANETLLKQMAEQSGGEYLREEEVSRLPELLSPLSSGRVVESETALWQSYWWFTAIVLLLTTRVGSDVNGRVCCKCRLCVRTGANAGAGAEPASVAKARLPGVITRWIGKGCKTPGNGDKL